MKIQSIIWRICGKNYLVTIDLLLFVVPLDAKAWFCPLVVLFVIFVLTDSPVILFCKFLKKSSFSDFSQFSCKKTHFFGFRYAHIDSIAKHGYKITNYLVDALNASIEYTIVNDWGYKLSKNLSQVTGMMGLMLRKEIDISGKSFFLQNTIWKHS